MKRFFVLFNFVLTVLVTANGQNDLKKIKGTWIVDSIIKIQDKSKAFGKYANKDEFLKFTFKNNSIFYVSTSPFDEGNKVPVSIKKDEITVTPDATMPSGLAAMGYQIPSLPLISESKYKIYQLTEHFLKLKTIDKNKDSILYCFSRQQITAMDTLKIEFPEFIIKHIDWGGGGPLTNNVVYNFKLNYYKNAIPTYKNSYNLGKDLSSRLNLKKYLVKEELSEELIVSIEVNAKGKVEKAIILKGINDYLDKKVLNFFKNSQWETHSGILLEKMTFKMRFIIIDSKII